MNDESTAWIDDALGALAATDAGLSPPAYVETAVLREWDHQQARQSRRTPVRRWTAIRFQTRILYPCREPYSGPRRAERAKQILPTSQGLGSRTTGYRGRALGWFVWALVPAAAGVFFGVAWIPRGPSATSEPVEAPIERAASGAAAAPDPPRASATEDGVATPSARPAVVPYRPRPVADAGYVIVPDPLVDPTTLRVVRVRMSRMALATLGMPLVNPDADSLVEVEILVGDEGVAQSIRRAALVSEPELGGER
jgi:hypothetical protein